VNVVNIVNVDPAVASDCGHPPQAAYVLRDRGHPTTTFSPEVNKTVNIDVSELTGVRYKCWTILADGIFCAYLANTSGIGERSGAGWSATQQMAMSRYPDVDCLTVS